MLCPQCGNEVRDPTECPVCKAGRGSKKPVRKDQMVCPRCKDPLDQQDWDGFEVHSCPTCNGSYFPDSNLEMVLEKLRENQEQVDLKTLLEDFKGRFTRQLPDAVRYKNCPACRNPMTRRNYATVSGVIVDVCSKHGTWVDEPAFASLTDFICRGGDQLAEKVSRQNARFGPRPKSGKGILGRLLGGS